MQVATTFHICHQNEHLTAWQELQTLIPPPPPPFPNLQIHFACAYVAGGFYFTFTQILIKSYLSRMLNVHTKCSMSCSSCTKLLPACATNTAEGIGAELPAQPWAIALGESKPHRFCVQLFSSQHTSAISLIFLDPSREDRLLFPQCFLPALLVKTILLYPAWEPSFALITLTNISRIANVV